MTCRGLRGPNLHRCRSCKLLLGSVILNSSDGSPTLVKSAGATPLPADWRHVFFSSVDAALREQHSMQQKVNILIRQAIQIGLPCLL